jgi:hypothetical protein
MFREHVRRFDGDPVDRSAWRKVVFALVRLDNSLCAE